nr:unnamed protein product [Spirometra erinaceieuropaei]
MLPCNLPIIFRPPPASSILLCMFLFSVYFFPSAKVVVPSPCYISPSWWLPYKMSITSFVLILFPTGFLQVKAADQLVALKAAKAEELNSRAEKAAEQMAIDKTVLHSSMERDDIFREPFERVKKHADFRRELDLNNKWVAERRQIGS